MIMLLIKKFFHDPICYLEITIKKFITWINKNETIVFEKTPNTDLNFILSFFERTLSTLKNIKDEFLHGKEIKSEVDLGKEIQGRMLEKTLTTIPSINMIIKSKAAGEIWWDSYDIIRQDDNYYIYVWDATGHGVWAGFIMVMVNALMSGFAQIYKSWHDILSKTNEILKPRVKSNLLMSLLLMRWNEKEKRIFMTWAGHEYLIVYKHSVNKTFKIKSWWVALGMLKDIKKMIKEQEIKFEKNDIIVLYSDGVTEAINTPAKNGTETLFWEERLMNAITNAPNVDGKAYKSARSVFNNITIELSKFMGYKHAQLDDITLAVGHYKGDDYDENLDFPEEIEKDFITEWTW